MKITNVVKLEFPIVKYRVYSNFFAAGHSNVEKSNNIPSPTNDKCQ